MAYIAELYNETLSNMYPYDFEIDENITGNDMLYNLCCISQLNFSFPLMEDVKDDYNKIMTLIELLTILGYKPITNTKENQ